MPLLSAFCPDDRAFGMTDCGEFSILNAGNYCVHGKHVAESLSRLDFINASIQNERPGLGGDARIAYFYQAVFTFN